MTVRQWMSRRARWWSWGLTGALIALALSLWRDPPGAGRTPVAFLVALPVVVAVSVAGHLFLFRCPRCRCNLAPLVVHSTEVWRGVDPRLVCCPYCTARLDDPMTEPEPESEHDRYQTEY